MKHCIPFLILLALSCSLKSYAQTVSWISSTDQNEWKKQKNINLKNYKSSDSINVEIQTNQKQQVIDGWGGCFNELGWDALSALSLSERTKVLKAFFDPKEGLKYNICRMPIGANDYARNWYSLDDTEGDFKMKNFSIKRDQSGLIPYIKAAMQFNPKLKVWASPWSPPTWMKTNHHYANAPGDHNDLTWANAVKSGNQFIQKPKYLSAYALYLRKFVESYQKEGINLYALHVQNEPYTINQWPNCSWNAAGLRNFIAGYLGPEFAKNKTNAQIWFSTINNGKLPVFDTVLANPSSHKYIAGVGFQYEGKAVVADIARKYPELKRMETETECGDGTFDWKAAEHTFNVMKTYLDGGVNAYMYWNMILDDTGKSSWGWKQNAQVIINKTSKKVTYTPEFYLFKHFTTYVVPGSVKVKSTGTFKNVLAFISPDNQVIIVADNTSENPTSLQIKIKDKNLDVTLAAKSFNTFVVDN